MTWILKYNNIQFKQNQNHNKNNYLQVKKTLFEKSRFSDFKQSYKFDHTTLNLYVNRQQTLSQPNRKKENKKQKKKEKENQISQGIRAMTLGKIGSKNSNVKI